MIIAQMDYPAALVHNREGFIVQNVDSEESTVKASTKLLYCTGFLVKKSFEDFLRVLVHQMLSA